MFRRRRWGRTGPPLFPDRLDAFVFLSGKLKELITLRNTGIREGLRADARISLDGLLLGRPEAGMSSARQAALTQRPPKSQAA